MAPTFDYANNSATGTADESLNPGIKSFLSSIIKSTPLNTNHNDQYKSTKDSTPTDLAAGDINAPPIDSAPISGKFENGFFIPDTPEGTADIINPPPSKNLNGKD